MPAPFLGAPPLPPLPQTRVSVLSRGVVTLTDRPARATLHLRGRPPQEAREATETVPFQVGTPRVAPYIPPVTDARAVALTKAARGTSRVMCCTPTAGRAAPTPVTPAPTVTRTAASRPRRPGAAKPGAMSRGPGVVAIASVGVGPVRNVPTTAARIAQRVPTPSTTPPLSRALTKRDVTSGTAMVRTRAVGAGSTPPRRGRTTRDVASATLPSRIAAQFPRTTPGRCDRAALGPPASPLPSGAALAPACVGAKVLRGPRIALHGASHALLPVTTSPLASRCPQNVGRAEAVTSSTRERSEAASAGLDAMPPPLLPPSAAAIRARCAVASWVGVAMGTAPPLAP